MSKAFAIVTIYGCLCFTTLFPAFSAIAQDTEAETPPMATGEDGPQYPIAVAVDGEDVYTVDLDLPGVWKSTDGKRTLFYGGSTWLRKTMNRPRPIVLHPDGGILVGDSATREIYSITGNDTAAVPLNGGFLGIPMALAVSPDGKTVYVGDAERRATFRFPIEGVGEGTPELVARVNARGLSFADDSTLYAVTPDADAVVTIDVTTGDVKPVCQNRPFQYPGGLVWVGQHGFVSDVYAKAIWKFTADGKTEKWFEGDPLKGPVLMTADQNSLFVAEPKNKEVYRFDLDSSEPNAAKPIAVLGK